MRITRYGDLLFSLGGLGSVRGWDVVVVANGLCFGLRWFFEDLEEDRRENFPEGSGGDAEGFAFAADTLF